MRNEDFAVQVERMLDISHRTLTRKGFEYSPSADDRLHNFRVASALTNESIEASIVGMMVKHIVSVFDMVNSEESYEDHIWDEKIGDAINYLLILRASVHVNKTIQKEEPK